LEANDREIEDSGCLFSKAPDRKQTVKVPGVEWMDDAFDYYLQALHSYLRIQHVYFQGIGSWKQFTPMVFSNDG